MPLKPAYLAMTVFVAVSLLGACSRHEPAPEPVRAVKVMTIGKDNINTGLEFAGEVHARVESRMGFRVGGKVVRRFVELGQTVKAGQTLAQLDPQDFRLSADAARAQLAAAATNRDLAAADFKRYKELKDQNFISGAELERRETTLKAAMAQFDQAQAQFSGQSNQAAYTTLVADVSGVVTAVDAEVGQVVAAGTPVFRIAQDGPRDAVFSVSENKIGPIKPGVAAQVRIWSDNDRIQGVVREVAASADPVTRTYQVKVDVGVARVLPLGSTVAVTLKAADHSDMQAIKVPTSALRKDGQNTAVWVLDPKTMTVASQVVEISTADGVLAVVDKGLQAGMQVVVSGVHVLSPGQKVSLYQDRYAKPETAPETPKAAPGNAPATVTNQK